MQFLALGAAAAFSAQYALQWLGHTPWWQRVSRRFIWWRPDAPPHSPYGTYAGKAVCSTSLLCDQRHILSHMRSAAQAL